MQFLQFGDDSQDQPQILNKLSQINLKVRPYRFIDDLNKKQCICYPNIDEENIYMKVNQGSRIRSLDGKTSEEQPILNKIQSLNQNLIKKKDGEISDPEKQDRKEKNNMRKRITIEKKLSEYDPLNGPGVIKLKDGKVVFGTWRDGEPVGSVKIVYPSGNIYIGEVKHYIRCGKGIFCYKNGLKYDGEFLSGKFSGFGLITNTFGEVVSKGVWSNGVLIQSII